MKKLDEGFIEVYTGNGKGKTTAAIGLAVRAAGYSLRSYIIQFMKEYPYNELNSLALLKKWIEIEQYCLDEFVYRKEPPGKDEIEKAVRGLKAAELKMNSGEFNIIVLDEVCVAIYFGLLKTEWVLDFIGKKPANVELILTGRYCPEEIIQKADLVTEMKEIKHYYQTGVLSRRGIES